MLLFLHPFGFSGDLASLGCKEASPKINMIQVRGVVGAERLGAIRGKSQDENPGGH